MRFWLELMNPSAALNGGPLGTGAVTLKGYQIQIRRETRKTGVPAANQDPNPFDKNQSTYLYFTPFNTPGDFDPSKGNPDATYTFGLGFAGAATPTTVSPNNGGVAGAYSPPTANLPARGIVLVGPTPIAKKGE